MVAIFYAKTLAQKRKRLLYLSTWLFVACFTGNAVIQIFVPFYVGVFEWADFVSDIFIFLALIAHFAQLKQMVNLLVTNRFILDLQQKPKQHKNRLTFMARLMNLGRIITNVCDDKPYSDELVAYGQRYCDDVFDRNEELTSDKIKSITAVLYKAMVYKVGKIDLSLCSGCCEKRFSSSGVTSGTTAARKI